MDSKATILDGRDVLDREVHEALKQAGAYAFEIARSDGHWSGECLSNATFTAEYIFLRQYLGLSFEDGPAMKHWLLSQQSQDGSWSIAPGLGGDVSTTAEAYLALKILGLSKGDPIMIRTQEYMLRSGGVEKMRNFTRFFLATFGLLPWASVPQLPAELILMPPMSPVNIYTLSSWARSTSIPLLVVRHHEPVYALPNGRSANNDFLDELWCDPTKKTLPYGQTLWSLLRANDLYGFAFTAADKMMYYLDAGLKYTPLRTYARKQVIKWVIDHQEEAGDWAGFLPPMWGSVLALVLEGFKVEDSAVKRGLEAIERLALHDQNGKRIQATVSPVWDTVLMSIGLCDAGLFQKDERLRRAVDWVKPLQQFGTQGDWRIYKPSLAPGGWSFEYFNTWYPDVDDTACTVLALTKQDPTFVGSTSIHRAVQWILGMQNLDGGWAAFDHNNDKLFLNKIPFSDMNSLCDPSTADVTGRIIECFGHILSSPYRKVVSEDLLAQMKISAARGISYLKSKQEISGSWWGRWGCNYVYGTSNVLCGLSTFTADDSQRELQTMVNRAVKWLKAVQNEDGGWGESVESYALPDLAGCGESTPSQTAWGVMALLAHLPPSDEAIRKGVAWLVYAQTEKSQKGATWNEELFTATGFPMCLYLEYSLYPHYFPMMALGRYLKATAEEKEYI